MFPSKGFQLLALLAAERGGSLGRKQAASLLWDSADDALALVNLRQLLARIRRLLPSCPDLVVADARSLRLGAGREAIDLWRALDVERARALEDISDALAIFSGDLLEGLEDGTEAFTDWLAIERAALREKHLELAAAALEEITRFGRADASQIAAIGARMLAIEPDRERSHRLVIEAYARVGLYAAADEAYRRLIAALHVDSVGRPAPETEALMRRIAASRPKAGDASVDRAVRRAPRVAFLPPAWLDGVTMPPLMLVFFEDVANELARYRSFTVLAPYSSFTLAQRAPGAADTPALRADYSVSGFLRPSADGYVIALRMTECQTHEIVWSAEFGLGAADLLTSFGLLVRRVASSLAAGFADAHLLSSRRSGDDTGYVRFLEGQRLLASSDLPSLRRARRAFQMAADRDPSAANIQARIGQTLYLEWIQLGGSDPHLLVAARAKAAEAIRLDPNNAAGHWLDATVAVYQRDFDHCQDKFAEAESLCPNSPDILVQYADALAHLGYADLGWRKFERAIDVNPVPPDHYWWAGASIAFRRRDYETAIALAGRVESEDSVLAILAASHAHLGDLPAARSYAGRLKDIYPGPGVRGKSTVAPDRLQSDRDHRLSGLKLAGVF